MTLLLLLPLESNAFAIEDLTPTAHYNLDEASGVRFDEVASFDLTDNNTVTQEFNCSLDECAKFNQLANEWLGHADDSIFDLSTSQSFSISVWASSTVKTGSPAMAGKWGSTISQRNWLFRMETSGVPRTYVGSGCGSTGVFVSGTTDISDGVDHNVIFTWDSSDDKLRMYVDSTLEGTSGVGSPSVCTAGFAIGGEDDSSTQGSANKWTGEIDHVSVFDYALSVSQVVDMYGGGTTPSYSAVSTASSSVNVVISDTMVSMLNSVACTVSGATTTCAYDYATSAIGVSDAIQLSGFVLFVFLAIFALAGGVIFTVWMLRA